MRYAWLAAAFLVLSAARGAVDNPSMVGEAQLNFTATGEILVSGTVRDLAISLYVVPEACENPVYSYGEIRSDEKGKYLYQFYSSVSSDVSWFLLCDIGQAREIQVRSSLSQFPSQDDYPPDISEYTEFTELVSYDEEIAARTSEVASGAETNLEAVMRLGAWVYANMEYDLSYVGAMKNASWVMDNRKGVCAEYSTLFMSMVRSLGIPVRYVSGWAYGNVYGMQFNTHAWTEVYLDGGWVPFDPTYGEFGYVDALHIPVSRTADGSESTIGVRWMPPGSVTIPNSIESDIIIAESSGFENVVSFESHLYRNETGVDDYTLLTLSVTNPTQGYVGLTAMIISTNSTEVAYGGERSYMVVPPMSTGQKNFILHMESCDRDYPYYCLNPLSVNIPGGGNRTTMIGVKPWITSRKSYNDILMMIQEDEVRLETGLEIVSIGMDDVFYDEPNMTITVRNTGNSIINGLVAHLTYGGFEDEIALGRLLINGLASGSAALDLPAEYGSYDMLLNFTSENFSHAVDRRFTYAQKPNLTISYAGSTIFRGFEPSNFIISLDYERCENVSITLTTGISSEHVPESAGMYNVTLPPEYFLPGANTLRVDAYCTDPYGTTFQFAESFALEREVGGIELILYQISSFFAWLFNAIKNVVAGIFMPGT